MKCKYIFNYIVFLFIANCFSQPFAIGHTTINFIDSSRGNRVVATEIYYPANSSGENVPLVSNSQLFPVLAFGHGFVMTWDAYQNIWSTLVPNGYIMAFPKTEGSISPSHLEFAKDLSFVLQQITILGVNSTSIFYNRVSSFNAVMGHSMGGGASFLAAQLNPAISVLVNFSAAETTPSAIESANSISIPALIFSGSNDCVTPASTNQFLMYSALDSNCKTYVSITGGSHCQMANSNFFCTIGESSCTPTPTITRSQQHLIISTLLLPWFDYQLKNNCIEGNNFDNLLINQSGITFDKNCIQCNPLHSSEEFFETIQVYPNPNKGFLFISGIFDNGYKIEIYDIQCKKLLENQITSTEGIDISSLTKGIYFYEVILQNKVVKTGKIVLQ